MNRVMDRLEQNVEKKYNKWIWILSIAIPLAVAALFGVSLKRLGFDVEPFSFLPPIYATINGITAIILVLAVIMIKKGNRLAHELLMKLAIFCSCCFLIMYVLYHMSSEPTQYGGEGLMKGLYLFILISHIILSIGIIPPLPNAFAHNPLTNPTIELSYTMMFDT